MDAADPVPGSGYMSGIATTRDLDCKTSGHVDADFFADGSIKIQVSTLSKDL